MWSIQFQLLRAFALHGSERGVLGDHVRLGQSRLGTVHYEMRVSDEPDENSVVAYGEVQLTYSMDDPDIVILMEIFSTLAHLVEGAELVVEDDMGLIDIDPETGRYQMMGNRHGRLLPTPKGLATWRLGSSLTHVAALPASLPAEPSNEADPPSTKLLVRSIPTVIATEGGLEIHVALQSEHGAEVVLDSLSFRLWDADGQLLNAETRPLRRRFRGDVVVTLASTLPRDLLPRVARLTLLSTVEARRPHRSGTLEWPEEAGSSCILDGEPGLAAHRSGTSSEESAVWFGYGTPDDVDATITAVVLTLDGPIRGRAEGRPCGPDGSVVFQLPTTGWQGAATLTGWTQTLRTTALGSWEMTL